MWLNNCLICAVSGGSGVVSGRGQSPLSHCVALESICSRSSHSLYFVFYLGERSGIIGMKVGCGLSWGSREVEGFCMWERAALKPVLSR